MSRMTTPFAVAFTEWERRYRESPDAFMDEAARLLGHTPATYGEACAAYFEGLLSELSAGGPWETIQAATT